MAALFNTLNQVEELKGAGIPTEHAEALTDALQEADLATKHDLKQQIKSFRAAMRERNHRLELQIQELKSTQIVHSWMLGFLVTATLALLGGVGSLVLKGFAG